VSDDDKTDPEKLEQVEREIARLQQEFDALRQALGDPNAVSWIDGQGRRPARRLSAFELATAKRLETLYVQIRKLKRAEWFLFEKVLADVARRPGEGSEDPEVLLAAALRCLAKAWKAGHRTVEVRVVLRALADYLRSLDEDEDGDELD
jgi:hypothetical protein